MAGVLAALLIAATAASAQTRPDRPYRGLFGGSPPATEDLLTLTLSTGGGFDTNVYIEDVVDPSAPEPAPSNEGYATLTAVLNFAWNTPRLSLAGSASTDSRYYTSHSEFLGAHSGSFGGSFQIARHTTLSASQSISYMPFLTLNLFPSLYDVLAPAPSVGQALDQGTARYNSVTAQSGVELARQIGRRTSIGLSYRYQRNDFGTGTTDGDFSTMFVQGQLQHGIARDLGVRLGYGYTYSGLPAAEDPLGTPGERIGYGGQNIDAGVDFSRSLSFSRRTTFSFGTGMGAVKDPNTTYYRLVGNARLNHEIGRTWNAGVAYDRNLGFLQAFSQPFFVDSITAGVSGMVHRRLQWRSNLYWSLGDVGFGDTAGGFDSFGATSGITLGLSRRLGVGVDYSYYQYSFDAASLLPTGLAHDLNRHGLHAYLSVWVPLLSRMRRP